MISALLPASSGFLFQLERPSIDEIELITPIAAQLQD